MAEAGPGLLDGVGAVVFDFGGVLITSITNQISQVAARHDVSLATMVEVLIGPHDSGDHPWHRAERGEIPTSAIQPALGPWAAAHGLTLHGDEIDLVFAPGGYEVVTTMLDAVDALSGCGIGTALLTNTFAEFRPTMDRDIRLARFDHVIESFAVGARKPEPEIYAEVSARLGVPGRSILYLDDFAQNLGPAIALGWRTMHVTDPTAAASVLHHGVSSRARSRGPELIE
jgi:putative hydrolase of the HAD superfamily